jgi:hypothetical protein
MSPMAKRLNLKRGSEADSRATNNYLTITLAGREMKVNILNSAYYLRNLEANK